LLLFFLKSYVPPITIKEESVHFVKRSDDDIGNLNWPLFFVQIQSDELLDIIDRDLDCPSAHEMMSKENIELGTLCVSYCKAYESMFRAVITKIYHEEVEVHYIDYGNYERVSYKNLRSIMNLTDIIKTHPAMGIPCLLSNFDEINEISDISMSNEEILQLQYAVSCERPFFKLKFLRKRIDNIMVVEYVPIVGNS
uniref:Tudor domain-containing protein n=1 Tax=Thelazia callipaeda TaxID=103827 RepID=A0A0N5CNR2_THECL